MGHPVFPRQNGQGMHRRTPFGNIWHGRVAVYNTWLFTTKPRKLTDKRKNSNISPGQGATSWLYLLREESITVFIMAWDAHNGQESKHPRQVHKTFEARTSTSSPVMTFRPAERRRKDIALCTCLTSPSLTTVHPKDQNLTDLFHWLWLIFMIAIRWTIMDFLACWGSWRSTFVGSYVQNNTV